MKQEGSLGVSRYVQFVLVVEVLKVFACLHLVALQSTATSLIDPLVIAPSLPNLATALVATSEIFHLGQRKVNQNILISSAKCESEEKEGICVLGLVLYFYIFLFIIPIFSSSLNFITYYLQQHHHPH